jgi:hypothetical protein
MDIGTLTGWIQLAMWIIGALLFAARLLRGEAQLPGWLSKHLSSNGILGTVIGLGLALSATTIYLDYARDHEKLLQDVTISAYPEGSGQQTLQLVSGQTFENENIPLDGHVYDHCTFTNVCLLYDGGAYQLQHATFKDHWKICVKEPQLKNYSSLEFALHLMRANRKQTQKSVLKQP